jgi:hypothetical protein
MNDPNEGFNEIHPEFRENVFASCWTAEERDELPMWKFYSDLKGVRLRMPIDLFNFDEKLEVSKREGIFVIKSKLKEPCKIDRFNEDYIKQVGPNKEPKTNFVFGPTAISYHETKASVCDNIVVFEDGNQNRYQVNLTLFGARKLNSWGFEKEFRYRIFYSDCLRIYGSIEYLSTFSNFGIVQKYLDISYTPESIEGVEILVAPNSAMDAEDCIVKTLRENGVQHFNVKRSEIEIRRD